jgi:hypothetical protein
MSVLISSAPDDTPYVYVAVSSGELRCFGSRDGATQNVVEGFPRRSCFTSFSVRHVIIYKVDK